MCGIHLTKYGAALAQEVPIGEGDTPQDPAYIPHNPQHNGEKPQDPQAHDGEKPQDSSNGPAIGSEDPSSSQGTVSKL